MRTQEEVLQALWAWASDDPNILSVILNGSRGDPNATPDDLSDYDAAVLVDDLERMRHDDWLNAFGEIMVRWPLTPQPTFSPDWITQLVLFRDGVRIDFQFTDKPDDGFECPGTYLCVLFDRDEASESIRAVRIEGVRIELPSEEKFLDRINAFWWDIPYVAKALHRDELTYARFSLDCDIRFNKLHPLLRWRIGIDHGWNTNVGVHGRWFVQFLDKPTWQRYLETFSGADRNEMWRAMFSSVELVRQIGRELASELGYPYPEETDSRVTAYLRDIQARSGEPGSSRPSRS